MLGDLDAAERNTDAARAVYTAIADHKGVCLAETISVALAMLRGDFAAVEDHGRSAEAHLRLSRDWFSPTVLYPALAEARSAQGDPAGAEAAIDMWKARGQGGRGPARLLVSARARRLDRVQSLLADGRSHLVLATWPSLFSVGITGAVAEAAGAVGRTELTEPLLSGLDHMRDKDVMFSPGWGASAHRVHAELLVANGETERACDAYRDAIDKLEEVGALPELARCQLGLGRLLTSADPRQADDAYEHLAAAAALSLRLGMPTVAEDAEASIDGLRRTRPAVQRSVGERDVKVLMFTDIVGSTRVSVEAGDDIYMELVDDHDAIVRRDLIVHRGTEVNSMGDGILAWFPTPTAALECAVAIHADVRARNETTGRTPLELRIGLAMGRPIHRHGNLYGATVNLASRLCAAARPGQALVDANISNVTAGRVRFDALEPLDLKGFSEPVRAYASHPNETGPETDYISLPLGGRPMPMVGTWLSKGPVWQTFDRWFGRGRRAGSPRQEAERAARAAQHRAVHGHGAHAQAVHVDRSRRREPPQAHRRGLVRSPTRQPERTDGT